MMTRAFLVHALSPLHAGTGQAADVIDLPIARMQATGIPFLPGSSIKGVLREARSRKDTERTAAVFGPPSDEADAHAGALVVGDARLLALPVRSLLGTFAWVTSPLLLFLTRRDLRIDLRLPDPPPHSARVPSGSACLRDRIVYLEDLDLEASECTAADDWARLLAPAVSPGTHIFEKRFAVVDDDTMGFLCETATQVDARVRIGDEGTVIPGALWLEESLPPETLLIGLLAADRSRREGVSMTPGEALDFALAGEEILRLGGKASTGRGRCRVLPLEGGGDVNAGS